MRRSLIVGISGLAVAIGGTRFLLPAGEAHADPNAPLMISNTLPGDAIAGQTDFIVKVYGDGFPANVGESNLVWIVWNGVEIPATIKSSTEVHIVVPADLVRNPGTAQLGAKLTGGPTVSMGGSFRIWRSSGDVNCNGTVTSSDALFVMRVLAGTATELNNCSIDANQDGDKDIEDAQWVIQDVARLVAPLKSTNQD